jgi:hypothetical protein
MKVLDNGEVFTIWLSSNDTHQWSLGLAPRGKNGRWPVSQLASRRIKATFDTSGLLDCTVDGRNLSEDSRFWVPVDEFNAIVADFAETVMDKEHPAFYVVVGQFARI